MIINITLFFPVIHQISFLTLPEVKIPAKFSTFCTLLGGWISNRFLTYRPTIEKEKDSLWNGRNLKKKKKKRLLKAFLCSTPPPPPHTNWGTEICVSSHQETDPSSVVLLRTDVSIYMWNGPEIVEKKGLESPMPMSRPPKQLVPQEKCFYHKYILFWLIFVI